MNLCFFGACGLVVSGRPLVYYKTVSRSPSLRTHLRKLQPHLTGYYAVYAHERKSDAGRCVLLYRAGSLKALDSISGPLIPKSVQRDLGLIRPKKDESSRPNYAHENGAFNRSIDMIESPAVLLPPPAPLPRPLWNTALSQSHAYASMPDVSGYDDGAGLGSGSGVMFASNPALNSSQLPGAYESAF